MNTTDKINKFFRSVLNDSSERLFLENEYTPPKGANGLRVKETVQPDHRATFNEVYQNAKKQLLCK